MEPGQTGTIIIIVAGIFKVSLHTFVVLRCHSQDSLVLWGQMSQQVPLTLAALDGCCLSVSVLSCIMLYARSGRQGTKD
jgi:hypothetical protein